MIYTFEEYKEKIKNAERYEFAKRYSITTNPQDILKKHNLLSEVLENENFLREMYKVYLQKKGVYVK